MVAAEIGLGGVRMSWSKTPIKGSVRELLGKRYLLRLKRSGMT